MDELVINSGIGKTKTAVLWRPFPILLLKEPGNIVVSRLVVVLVPSNEMTVLHAASERSNN